MSDDDYAFRAIHRAQDALAETIAAHTVQWLKQQGVMLTDTGEEKLIEFFRYYTRP